MQRITVTIKKSIANMAKNLPAWRQIFVCCLVMCVFLFLTACGKGSTTNDNNIPNESNDNVGNVENGSDVQQEISIDQTSIDNANRDILAACASTTITQTIESSAGKTISVDAQVDVEGISRVRRYRYIPYLYTEEFRKTWFKHQFFSETWDVNEAAVYNEEKAAWEIVTPIGRKWVYQVSDSGIPGEQVMNLERVDIEMDYAKENDVYPARISDVWSLEELELYDRINSNPMEIADEGQWIMEKTERTDIYSCSYVHIYGKDSEQPYVKALYRQVLDGMPVTVWHNLSTISLKDGPFPIKIWGSLFSVEEIGLAKPILSVEEAVTALQERIDSLQIQEAQISVTQISLEYLSVISSDGEPEVVPVWRFWLGDDEMERSLMSEKILAVNAVSGELIWEERGAFME